MEEQEILKTEIGTIESEKTVLKPARVKIVNVSVELIESIKAQKVVFEVKHPDRDTNINISTVSYLDGREIATSGTWLKLDKENKIQKGSALVILLSKLGAKNLTDSIGKEIDTELEGKYLCFKAY